MKKSIFAGLSLLTITTVTHASAILVTPSSPLTVVTNGSSETLDINGDGINEFVFTSTYSNSPYGFTDDAGTPNVTDDYHYQGTTELTTMELTSLSGLASGYAISYNWLTSPSDLAPVANLDIYSYELGS